jgi:hypothetical protein
MIFISQQQTGPEIGQLRRSVPAGHWWFTLIILPTQEAEIRTAVQNQSKQIVHKNYLKKTHHKKGLHVYCSTVHKGQTMETAKMPHY